MKTHRCWCPMRTCKTTPRRQPETTKRMKRMYTCFLACSCGCFFVRVFFIVRFLLVCVDTFHQTHSQSEWKFDPKKNGFVLTSTQEILGDEEVIVCVCPFVYARACVPLLIVVLHVGVRQLRPQMQFAFLCTLWHDSRRQP